MRIAVFIKNTTHHKNFGGFETQNQALCEGLVQKGHVVTVFAPRRELSGETQKTELNGVKYIFVDCIFRRFSVLFSASAQSWENQSYVRFQQLHSQEPFDLVISQSSWGLGIIKHKKALNIPVIAIAHGSKMGEATTRIQSIRSLKALIRFLIDVPHILRAFFITQRQFIHGADKVIAVSNAVKKQLVNETFVSEDKIIVINNGVNAHFKAKEDKSVTGDDNAVSSREVQIIYVGRTLREKGLFVLLEALAKIDSQLKFKVTIIGDGEDLAELKSTTSLLNLQDVVIFKGWLSQDDVILEYQKSDIFVLPSLRVEGFPMTLVEAMFSSLPVVASNIGGNSDAVFDGETGYLVTPGKVQELVQRLETLIKDAELRASFAQNALQKANKNFTLDAMLTKYEQVFAKVMNK